MTKVTAVPLRPIRKGTLRLLWLGLAALLAVALAYGWWTAQVPHITMKTIKAGEGASPTATDVVLVNYKGQLADGTMFDQSNGPVPMPVAAVVPGFSMALQRMQVGGSYRVTIPAKLAYGDEAKRDPSGKVVIPANSPLTFDVDLIDFKSEQEVRAAQQAQMQQMQMQQMQVQPGQSTPRGR